MLTDRHDQANGYFSASAPTEDIFWPKEKLHKNNIYNRTTFYTPLHKQISASKQNNNELLNVRQLLKENKQVLSNKRTKKDVNFKRRGQL